MTNLERLFLQNWRLLANGPEPEDEYRFHPVRRFRFDFAWPDAKVAVECEGGIWSRGRHTRGKGYENDCIKYNLAQASGWRVFRCTGGMLVEDPSSFVEQVREALGDR